MSTGTFFTRIRSLSHFNVIAGVVVAVAVAAVGYTLFFAHAAGPFATVNTSSATVSGNASIVTDSTSSQGKVLQFGTPLTGSAGSYSCITAAVQGHCPNGGGYYNYPQISVADFDSNASSYKPNPWVNPNIWGAGGITYNQTVYANSPSDWYVTANVASNPQGGVLAYPNAGWNMPWDNSKSNPETPIDRYTTTTSSWNVTIPTDNTTTDGWAAYDLWFNNWADEVMIQTDITADSNYDCSQSSIKFTNVSIDGQAWHMCQFGAERVVKPGADEAHLRNQSSGTLNIQDILKYLENNGYIPAGSTWTAGSFGFEVCQTHGTTQTFRVNGLTWTSQ